MRKILLTILIFVFFFLICQAGLPAGARRAEAGFVSTIKEGVRLRTGPGTEYKILMDMGKYWPLRVLAKSKNWYKVENWMGKRGWVYGPLTSYKTKTAVIRKVKVNFRSGPGTRYRKIATLYKGYIVKVLKKYYRWVKVKVVDPPEDQVGWVYRTLLWGI